MMKEYTLDEKAVYIVLLVAVSFVIVYVGGKVMLWFGRWLKSKIVEDTDDGAVQS